jgi:uncharacterized protein YegP (UPF0339 family)
MKLPFDFGVKLIFRLVIPGLLLSLGFLPLLNTGLELFGWTARFDAAFVTLIILLGWLITISDMSIYMLVEGRRWWPRWIKRIFIGREAARLRRLVENSRSGDSLGRDEAYTDLSAQFPMTDDGEYCVVYPSRLGNLLRAFELYSRRVYGFDSIFYWWRIWLKLDKETREEVDSGQALADSSTYACFCLFFCSSLMVLYLGLEILKAAGLRVVPSLGPHMPEFLVVLDNHLPGKRSAAALAFVFFGGSFLVYRLSLYLHAQFGELFKSVIDLNVEKIELPVIKQISALSEQSPVVMLPRRLPRMTKFQIAVNYLQYYRYYCPNWKCLAFLKPNEIAKHVCVEYHVYQEPSGSWRWRVETTTGHRILVDHDVVYKSHEDCLNEIALIKQSSEAEVAGEEKFLIDLARRLATIEGRKEIDSCRNT